MSQASAYLVVGADSLVGSGLTRALEGRGLRTLSSTRRSSTVGGRRIYLDFDAEPPAAFPREIGYAFIVAAATNYDRCETDPSAWRTNVQSIPRIAAWMLERGIFVTFISTNSVFGGERPWPNEDDLPAPGIAYARHKTEGEQAIRTAARRLGAEERLSIVRLTKILAPETPPLPAWLSAWRCGEPVQPFADLIFAPMSVQFVGNALATIAEKRVAGHLHLSGAENVSYVEFARALADRMGVDPRLIAATTSVEKGVKILFKPRYSGIGMRRTTELTGIRPQPLKDVVADLLSSSGKLGD